MLKTSSKLVAVNRDNQEEHPRNNVSRDTIALRANEVYITQVSEKLLGRVSEKMSQEFNRTEPDSRNKFFLN